MIRLIFGIALGYLLGTLLAPRKGSETRGELARRFDDIKGRSKAATDELAEGLSKASQSLEYAGGVATEAVGKLNTDMRDIARKGQEVVKDIVR
jgi:gas vesicle protein